MGGLPDGWFDYSPVGSSVSGTRFIPFKVPLKEYLCRTCKVPEEEWFTPKALVEKLKENGLELGLVIDLTNTKRYYDPTEITSAGIGYEKIFTEGRVVPSVHVRNNFFDAVDRFLASNENNNRLIGVHCTHGLNRTGYLVCRYMIDRMKFEAKDAIKAFNQARGYDIERTEYVNDLIGSPALPNHDSSYNSAFAEDQHAESVNARFRSRDLPQRGSPRQSYPHRDTYSNPNQNGFSRSGAGYYGDGNDYYPRQDAYSRSRAHPSSDPNRDGSSRSRSGASYYGDGNAYPRQDAHSRSRAGRHGYEDDDSSYYAYHY